MMMRKIKIGKKIPILFAEKSKVDYKLKPILETTRAELEKFCEKIRMDDDLRSSLHDIIESLVHFLGKDKKTMRLLERMHAHGTYLFPHAIAVSMMSLFVSYRSGIKDSRMLELVTYGGLFHDVGLLAYSPEQIENSVVFETKKDYRWKEIEQHGRLGIKLLEGADFIPEEVRFIIAQHHEREDGMGYPAQIPGEVVFYPTKIISIADSFCALIADRAHRKAFDVQKALEIMQSETGKFEPKIFACLYQIFHETAEEKTQNDSKEKIDVAA